MFGSPRVLAAQRPAPCHSATVSGPERASDADRDRAKHARVIRVTDENTKSHPVVLTYEHRAGVTVFHRADVEKELIYTTVQISSRAARANLWLRAEFNDYPTDVDLYVYSSSGDTVGYSESSNNEVLDAVADVVFYESETGGPGFENINGLRVRRCAAYSVETQNSQVVQPTPVRLLLWLGPRGEGGHS